MIRYRISCVGLVEPGCLTCLCWLGNMDGNHGMPNSGEIGEETERLLLEVGGSAGEGSWRLNFDGFQRAEHKEKQPRRLHDCLGVLGTCLSVFSCCVLFT